MTPAWSHSITSEGLHILPYGRGSSQAGNTKFVVLQGGEC
jgi:hypothetical protein